MNILNKDVSGQNFDGQILDSSLLRGANISNCSFVGSDLSGSNFRDVNMEGADFTDAILHGSNFKDATGTANFTNAKIRLCPKWVDFIDADVYTLPDSSYRRDVLINTLFDKASVLRSALTEDDELTIEAYIDEGLHGSLIDDYGTMPEGNMVYDVLRLNHRGNSFSTVVNAHIAGNVYYNEETKTFVKGEEDG